MADPGLDAALWGLALLVFGIGDVITTAVGIRYYGLRETNPLVVRILGPSPPLVGTVAFKVVVLGAAAVVDRILGAIAGFPASIMVPFFILGIGFWAVHANTLQLWRAHHRQSRG